MAGFAGAGEEKAKPKWSTYGGCWLIPDTRNDGDTLVVKTRARRYMVELYFVDCPDMDLSNPDRVGEQAGYWGVPEEEVLRFGKKAQAFTEEFVSQGFTVFSRREDPGGLSDPPRILGVVRAGDLYLCEALMRRGLARIAGPVSDLPDGSPASRHLNRLKNLERQAQKDRAGIWGGKKGRRRLFKAPPVEKHDVVLFKPLVVYTTDERMRYLGKLPKGTRLTVLRSESPTTLRLQFLSRSGPQEVRCYWRELAAHPVKIEPPHDGNDDP